MRSFANLKTLKGSPMSHSVAIVVQAGRGSTSSEIIWAL